MEAYAKIEDYKKYSDVLKEDTQIEKYLKVSSFFINEATLTRIEKIGFENLTEQQRKYIKEATCEEADYIYESGMFDEPEEVSSYSIGGDLTVTTKQLNTAFTKLGLSRTAYMILKKTGLTWRGL